MMDLSTDERHPLAEAFRAFVNNLDFPCVGAKSALAREQMRVLVARDITSGWDDLRIHPLLTQLVADYQRSPDLFQTVAIIFEQPGDLDEEAFETALWERIQSLSDKDEWLGQKPDPRVSADPEDSHFSLSFAGEAFFVVGLHPNASRPARRFERPCLVFNLHDQFEQLRTEGRYEKLRESILERDISLAGSINPMIERHGHGSEARQYSGRAVDDGWVCPYQRDVAEIDEDLALLRGESEE